MSREKKPTKIGRESEVKEIPTQPTQTWTSATPPPSSFHKVSSAVSLAAFLPLPFSWPKADVIIFNEHLQKLHIKHAAGRTAIERGRGRQQGREPGARWQTCLWLECVCMWVEVRSRATNKVELKKMLQTLVKTNENL